MLTRERARSETRGDASPLFGFGSDELEHARVVGSMLLCAIVLCLLTYRVIVLVVTRSMEARSVCNTYFGRASSREGRAWSAAARHARRTARTPPHRRQNVLNDTHTNWIEIDLQVHCTPPQATVRPLSAYMCMYAIPPPAKTSLLVWLSFGSLLGRAGVSETVSVCVCVSHDTLSLSTAAPRAWAGRRRGTRRRCRTRRTAAQPGQG